MYYSIFAWNGLIHLQASPCWHKNGLACTDSMLLYKPAWLAYGQRAGCWHGKDNGTDRQDET